VTTDPATAGLNVFVVGGAVRDQLLGEQPGDHDWVVVGSTPEEMVRRGFTPVGGDFPVFLHPRTRQEYALARTERKSGRGYRGFTFYTGPDVTLEDDLCRRDLTVNAIARASDGTLFDPTGGVKDLTDRVLRHVGPAFEEDPVRVLRLARFAARFVAFRVAPETLALCRRMVDLGEVDALVPERVWQELSRGLLCIRPSRMLSVLAETGALARVMPELREDEQIRDSVDAAARASLPLQARYALLCRISPDRAGLARRLRAPTECADWARLLPGILASANKAAAAEDIMGVIEVADGVRKPERLLGLMEAAQIVMAVDTKVWRRRLEVVLGVDAGAIARAVGDPREIGQAVRLARVVALAQAESA
jgi:tRNA nucleotidyltransferase (CCA-adding enzyme)